MLKVLKKLEAESTDVERSDPWNLAIASRIKGVLDCE
jgi:hypothetical protein